MFTIHRSERADALVDALVDTLGTPLDDPFAAEVVAVPTRGVERWLTHRIGSAVGTSPGRADGVCANVQFPSPNRLVDDLLSRVAGVDADRDRWRVERLTWPLLQLIDEHGTEDWLSLLGSHIGAVPHAHDDFDDLRRRRRWPAANHVASLFHRYGVYRPDVVRTWLERDAEGDAADEALPADARWQPELYRRLRALVGTPSPPERVAGAANALVQGRMATGLPSRISLFGLTRLPATTLEVLRALAVHTDVNLFVLHPSLTFWDRVENEWIDHPGLAPVAGTPPSRADDRTQLLPVHPLLRTWAQDSRELQTILRAASDAHESHEPLPLPADDHPPTVLGMLQDDIRRDANPPPPGHPPTRILVPTDRSIQIHTCHGRARQVSVLRDAIAHALADDPTLEPRDVIVLCPDIDDFAPLLHAQFGAHLDEDGDLDDATRRLSDDLPHLPYRLADRSLRVTNPLLAALADLLDLLRSRMGASEVLAFAGRAPVRRRFGLDDDALSRIRLWIDRAGVRWGLDADHRAPWRLSGVGDATWHAGLERLLLGVTMDVDGARLVGGRLPVDEVDSGDVDLAGRVAELVSRLRVLVAASTGTQPVRAWADFIAEATDMLFAPAGGEDWQRAQVDEILREVVAESEGGDPDHTALALDEVRALLDRRLQGEPTRADFRTGAITMCSLLPMRAVPHRVVCILGLDEGVFPRIDRGDGDDLLRADPRLGDPDRGAEDRQLLLDAVLSATETLIVTYAGRDERTNEPRPPSVPVHELVAVLDRTARTADGVGAGHAVRVEHPLQPHDPRAFTPGVLRHGRSWGFDRDDLSGARAQAAPTQAQRDFLDPPLAPAQHEEVVTLDDLIRFFHDPFAGLLRQRLDLSTWDDDDTVDDHIPVEFDSLQAWGVGDRILRRLRSGLDLDTARAAEVASGCLPPGAMVGTLVDDAAATAERIHDAATRWYLEGTPASRAVDVTVDGPRPVAVVGAVGGLYNSAIGEVSYSALKPKARLTAWIRLLALTASAPATPWTALTVGRKRDAVAVVALAHLGETTDERAAQARMRLGDLVRLRALGLATPLPLPCQTAEAWASGARRNRSERDARQVWEGNRFGGERDTTSVARFFGVRSPLERLLAEVPTEAETGLEWTDDPSRFARLARRVWDPILAREQWS